MPTTTAALQDQVRGIVGQRAGVRTEIRGTAVYVTWPDGAVYIYPDSSNEKINRDLTNLASFMSDLDVKRANASNAQAGNPKPPVTPDNAASQTPAAIKAADAPKAVPGAPTTAPTTTPTVSVSSSGFMELPASKLSAQAGASKVSSVLHPFPADIPLRGGAWYDPFISPNASPLAPVKPKNFRGRTGTPYSNDRGQDPPTYIEVVQMPKDPQSTADLKKIKALGIKYNDFFITDTQEMDAEKADVSETFGAPHVFATGRYMRKVTIQGVCRTGAVNPDLLGSADQVALQSLTDADKARYVVPHTLGLRVLYDKLLRASEQVSRGLFSRLVVDGEVYCGWFTTLNIARTSSEESFAHFTMSMLVFSRYHPMEDRANDLLNTGSLPAKQAFDDSSALATLAAQAGVMKITLDSNVATVKQTFSETVTGPQQFQQVLTMKVEGVSQPVAMEVTSNGQPIQGFYLFYGNNQRDRTPLQNSSPGVGTFDLVPAVTDFAAFLKSAQSAIGSNQKASNTTLASATAGLQSITLSIKMKPASGDTITELLVSLQFNTIRTPVISGMQVFIGSNTDAFSATVAKPAADVFQTNTTMALKLRFFLQASGSPLILAEPVLAGAKLALLHPTTDTELTDTVGPTLSATVGTIGSIEKTDTDLATKPGNAVVSVPAALFVLSPTTGQVEVTVTFDFAQLAAGTDLRTTNPFGTAKDLGTAFRFKLKLPGYNDVITPAISVSAEYTNTSWIVGLIQSIASARAVRVLDSAALATRVAPWLVFNLAPASVVGRKAADVQSAVLSIVKASNFTITMPNDTAGFFSQTPFEYTADMSNAVLCITTSDLSTVTVKSPEYDGALAVPSTVIMNPPAAIRPILMFSSVAK